MHTKRNRLGKKGGILEISALTLVFSFISIIYIFIAVFLFATSNDYIFVELQNISETLEQQGIIKNGTSARTQTYGETYQEFNYHLDDLWFIAYLVFIISSLIVSYKAERQNYFSFLGILFYGLMFVLFLLTLFSTITNWFKDEILLSIVPTAYIVVPKFYYYLDHIGIFSAIHLVVCLLVNMIDLDLAKIFQKKKEEEAVMNDEEVV